MIEFGKTWLGFRTMPQSRVDATVAAHAAIRTPDGPLTSSPLTALGPYPVGSAMLSFTSSGDDRLNPPRPGGAVWDRRYQPAHHQRADTASLTVRSGARGGVAPLLQDVRGQAAIGAGRAQGVPGAEPLAHLS